MLQTSSSEDEDDLGDVPPPISHPTLIVHKPGGNSEGNNKIAQADSQVPVIRSWATGLPLQMEPRKHTLKSRPLRPPRPKPVKPKVSPSHDSLKDGRLLPPSSSSEDDEELSSDDSADNDGQGSVPFLLSPREGQSTHSSASYRRPLRPEDLEGGDGDAVAPSSQLQLPHIGLTNAENEEEPLNPQMYSESNSTVSEKQLTMERSSRIGMSQSNLQQAGHHHHANHTGSYENIFLKSTEDAQLNANSNQLSPMMSASSRDLGHSKTFLPLPSALSQHSRKNSATSFTSAVESFNEMSRRLSASVGGVSSSSLQMLEPLDDSNRRERLILYVLVSRCIAYTFHSKYPTEQKRFLLKVEKSRVLELRRNFHAFLQGDTGIAADEAFRNAVQSYYEVVLRSDRLMARIVCGCLSMFDLRELFRTNIEKRIHKLPPIEGLSKETVLNSWLGKFDHICRWHPTSSSAGGPAANSACAGDLVYQQHLAEEQKASLAAYLRAISPQTEVVLAREKLYDLFQQILGVKRYEHQILFNACQFDNVDEQAAQVRRELDIRKQKLEERKRNRIHPKVVVKEMESIYFQEEEQRLSKLSRELESVPVSQAGWTVGLQRLKMMPGRGFLSSNSHLVGLASSSGSLALGASADSLMLQENGAPVVLSGADQLAVGSKLNLKLSFNVEIELRQLRRIHNLSAKKVIFCTMQVAGGEKKMTNQAEAANPVLQTVGEFSTNQPQPLVKVKLMLEHNSLLSLDHKEIAKLELYPKCGNNRAMRWYRMQPSSGGPLGRLSLPGGNTGTSSNTNPTIDPNGEASSEEIQIQLALTMSKPPNLKQCGLSFVEAKSVFKKWKQRFLCLIQVSQFTFVLASYKKQKSEPSEWLRLDGFTVDYCDTKPELQQDSAKYFFTLVKEGDQVLMSTEQESERHLWVQALYRATGQSHKPTPPTNLVLSRAQQQQQGESNRAQQLGLHEFVIADPSDLPHADLFRLLHTLTLQHRLHMEPFVSLGWLSPVENFVLEEFVSRYGVRESQRALIVLAELIRQSALGNFIDPTLLLLTYSTCAQMMSGKSANGTVNSVLADDVQQMTDLKDRLLALLEKQIVEFRYSFPFGRPAGALKQMLALVERVLMSESANNDCTGSEELRPFIHRCLQNAAMLNYTRISGNVNIDDPQADVNKKFEDLLHLADLCIEVVQENSEFYTEPFLWFSDLMVSHTETFWSLFSVDMNLVLSQLPKDYWETFTLFQLLNDYLLTDSSLCRGAFHRQLLTYFAPNVVRYLDLHESNMMRELCLRLDKEIFQPQPVLKEDLRRLGSTADESDGVASESLDARKGSQASSGCSSGTGKRIARHASLTCGTVNELLWKMHHLQEFVDDLRWPDEEFAQHLRLRVATMGSDLINVTRLKLEQSFQTWLKRGNSLQKAMDYLLPLECFVMINSAVEMQAFVTEQITHHLHSSEMHQYHCSSEESVETLLKSFLVQATERLLLVLNSCLKALARYDENTIVASLLSLTRPVDELGKQYAEFMSSNLEKARCNIRDEVFLLSFFENWFIAQMQRIHEWLQEREEIGLHTYQLTCVLIIVQQAHQEFSLHGVRNDIMESAPYEDIVHRLKIEEATQSVKQSSALNKKTLESLTHPSSGVLTSSQTSMNVAPVVVENNVMSPCTDENMPTISSNPMSGVKRCSAASVTTNVGSTEDPTNRRSVFSVVGGSLRTLTSGLTRRPS